MTCTNELCKRTNWISVEQIERHGFIQLARIHRILDEEEARLKELIGYSVIVQEIVRTEGSLATIRKIRSLI